MTLVIRTAIPLCSRKLLPTVISSNSECYAFEHNFNLANNIGGWSGVGTTTSVFITNFNLRRSQFRKKQKFGLD